MAVLLLSGLALVASLPAVVLGVECLLALLPLRRDRRAERGERPPLAVIVPAHNEAGGIAETIDAILPQLSSADRLLVIADNCTDRTAEVARQLGAAVLERFNDQLRGKGYAVQFALEHLASDPPAVVINIDADCQPLPGCLERIARVAFASGHPVQAAYLMQPPEAASPGTRVSALAVLVKNYVRPRGLQRLKLPCLITGSGVAYPWSVLQQVPLPQSHIVEDMDYSIDLALAGLAPLPCMEAVIESRLPDARTAAHTQRTRWEHGHLSVILAQGPRLLAGALRKRSVRLLAMWLELIVPPLSLLLCLLGFVGAGLLLVGLLTGIWEPASLFACAASVGVIGLTLAWWRFGRRVLPTAMLGKVPHYVLGKLAIYGRFVSSRETAWVPTARDQVAPSTGDTPSPHFAKPRLPSRSTKVE